MNVEPIDGSVRVGRRRVRFREAGRGPAVVLIAGLGLSRRFYDRSYAAFASAGLRLIVPDLPGSGGTRGPLTGFDAAHAADFLIDFAESLDITRAGWIGHSIGWQAGLHLAVAQPDMVAALVAAAPTLPRPGRRAAWQLAHFAVAATRVDAAVVRGIARDYVRTTPFQYIGTWLRHAQDNPLERVAAVRCPLLVLVGGRDPMAAEADVTRLLQTAPAARLAEIADGTHGLPRQSAGSFNRITTRFLRQVLLR